MRPLHIIMPMAGEGSRFLRKGFTTPKPLIVVNGRTLLHRSIGCVEAIGVPKKYSFIVRKEHIDKYSIDKRIKAIIPEAYIFSVEKTTRGAVETCLLAEDVIEENDAILVLDCDLEFKSKKFVEEVRGILSMNVGNVNGGILVSFKSSDPRYSYAEIDENSRVVRTAEKEVISNHALCGAYFFSKAESFLSAAHTLVKDSSYLQSEFYVSILYNYLLKHGEIVTLVDLDEYYSYGTPEEISILNNNE